MNPELAAPVKVITNAFLRGVSQTQKICKFAQKTSATLMLDTLQPAQSLEKSLNQSEERIRDTYNQSIDAFGPRYAHALDNDHITTNRLHALALNILEQLNSLDDYVFDPASFDLGSFPYIQRESERCCDQAIIALKNLHQELLKIELQQFQLKQDDRVSLPSARRGVGNSSRRLSDISPMTEKPTLGLGILLEAETNNMNSARSPTQPDSNVPMGNPHHSSQSGSQSSAISSSTRPGASNLMGPVNHSSQSRSPSNTISTLPQSLASITINSPDHNSPIGTQRSSISYPPKPDAYPPKALPDAVSQNKLQAPPVSQAESRNHIPAESHVDAAVPAPLRLIAPNDKTAIEGGDDRQLIKKEEVSKQINAIDEFLAKRMRSRESFRYELNRISMISTTISPISPHPSFTVSPILQSTPSLTDSPVINSRPTSTLLTTIMETMDAGGPPVPPKDDPWKSPSPMEGDDSGKMLTNEQDEPRKDSETLVHGMPTILPDTPPDSLGRQSATDNWGTLGVPLADTLKVPGFGDGVVDGIEVVGQKLVSDPGLIPASENQNELRDLTPATSVQSVDYAMRHDSSFFKYGGFCDSAKMSWRGAGGTMKEVTRPGGMYIDVKVMRCITCSFEVGYNDFHRDRRLEKAGTLKCQDVNDIEYRTRFLIKSHVKTKLADSPIFACMFCVEENRTLEEQDATVFFSTAQFLRHVQKHPRRLKEVDGIKIVYGPLPENVVDFDLHFLTLEAKPSPTADIKAQIASGGTGYAIANHRPGARGFKAVDPERRQTLQFAIGARIVGITYPAPFNGDWCSGYHDSVKALFPSSAVQLDSPPKDDVMMNQKSSLGAVAKWDYRPKDNIGGWLSFNKKERISHIAYPYQEFWCWSGMNSRGKWGIFPRDFVDGLVDTGSRAEPTFSPGSFATSPTTSGSASHHSSRKFMLSGLGSHSSHKSHGGEREPDQGRPSSNPFNTKRKTSAFASSFVRRSTTVKSHMSGGSAEYASSMASQGSGSSGDAHNEGTARSPDPPKPRELQQSHQPQQPRAPLDITQL